MTLSEHDAALQHRTHDAYKNGMHNNGGDDRPTSCPALPAHPRLTDCAWQHPPPFLLTTCCCLSVHAPPWWRGARLRQHQPLDLSHRSYLTSLRLSAVAPLLAGDKLPASLLRLHARQCFDAQPLLGLSRLRMLALRPSTVPGGQLLALTQLTALREVKLFYEARYYQARGSLDRLAVCMQQHAAVWPKLPLCSLGFYQDFGMHGNIGGCGLSAVPMPAECLAAVAQLTGLTHLVLDWTVSTASERGLLQVVQQLTKLRHLAFCWCWITLFNLKPPALHHTREELQVAATGVRSLMRGICDGLPQLQQLQWLCDFLPHRMRLDLAGLQGALKDLGPAAPGSVTMQGVHDAVEPWLVRQDVAPPGMLRHLV